MQISTRSECGWCGSCTPIQDGGDHSDPYVCLLMQQLRSGQSKLRNYGLNRSVKSDISVPRQNQNHLGQSDVSESWRDPQINVASVTSGKSASLCYDIADFVSNNIEEEEIIVGNNVNQQSVVITGQKSTNMFRFPYSNGLLQILSN